MGELVEVVEVLESGEFWCSGGASCSWVGCGGGGVWVFGSGWEGGVCSLAKMVRFIFAGVDALICCRLDFSFHRSHLLSSS